MPNHRHSKKFPRISVLDVVTIDKQWLASRVDNNKTNKQWELISIFEVYASHRDEFPKTLESFCFSSKCDAKCGLTFVADHRMNIVSPNIPVFCWSFAAPY